MYYIIFVDDWCSIVPHLWINETTRTFKWPIKQVSTAIKKSLPPNSSWSTKHYRRIAGPYGNYK